MGDVDYSKLFARLEQDKLAMPNKKEIIDTLKKKGRLLGVKGSMDYIQEVVPHCYASEKALVSADGPVPPLGEYTAVLVGCPGDLNSKWRSALKTFVANGGFLITTDWALALLHDIFPGYISYGGTASGDKSIKFCDLGHPFLEGIKGKGLGVWHVETASHTVMVDAPKAVKVLLSAKDLDPDPVMVTFPYEKGTVVHFISHFHLQKSDNDTRYVCAFILTNIIEEATRQKYHLPVSGRVRLIPEPRPVSFTEKRRIKLL